MHGRMLRTMILVGALIAFAHRGDAQETPGVWIRSVTVDLAAHTLTITGTGFSQSPEVTLDGQPMIVLPGASATQITIALPADAPGSSGTYRLTVTDPLQHVGD